MQPTILLYLEHMQQYTCNAQVVSILTENGKSVVILDQTVFYPQGGGQPYDLGRITSADGAVLVVEEVRKDFEDVVRHIGVFEGAPLVVGATVQCAVDVARRELNTRCHSGGHLLDMGLKRLGIMWQPGKGYHFPVGPYVEYTGLLADDEVESTRATLEAVCNQVIDAHIATHVTFIPGKEKGRMVQYGDFGILCGGTHVANLADIGLLTVKKIKKEKGVIRVSYLVA